MSDFRSPYAGYDVLEKSGSASWNDRTRDVVRRRLGQVPPRRFLAEREWRTLEAICDRVVPQPERDARSRVPIAPWIDAMLETGASPGHRFEDMPPMREAWRLGLRSIDDECVARCGRSFADVAPEAQDEVLRAVQRADVRAAWEMPPERFFASVLVPAIVAEYYAHPAAWSEIGFGGPASPRGYVRLGTNRRDPWEASRRDDQHE